MDAKEILNAKIGKVPVLAVGVPAVVLVAFASRYLGKGSSDSTSQAADTGQPIMLAKSTPANWLALDQTTGVAYSADGAAYVPAQSSAIGAATSGGSVPGSTDSTGATSNPSGPATPPPATGGGNIVVTPTGPTPAAPVTSAPAPLKNIVITPGMNWNTISSLTGKSLAQLRAEQPGGSLGTLKAGMTIRA